jgi:predicted metal-dependent hydrolase
MLFFSRPNPRRLTRADYLRNKPAAAALVRQKIAELNAAYGFEFRAVSIRNQKTRWGSCSRRGNLSFNWRILLLDSRAQDYLIVHELCHLAEFNHSPRFWALVSQTVPEYAALRRRLRRVRLADLTAARSAPSSAFATGV